MTEEPASPPPTAAIPAPTRPDWIYGLRGLLFVLGAFGAATFVWMCFSSLWQIAMRVRGFYVQPDFWTGPVPNAIWSACMLFAACLSAVVIRRIESPFMRTIPWLRLNGFRALPLLTFLVLTVGWLLASPWLSHLLGGSSAYQSLLPLNRTPAIVLMVFASSCLMSPLAEEIIYRGIAWPLLTTARWRPWLIATITSLIFATGHQQYTPVDQFSIFLFGLILAGARHFSGSLTLPLLLHVIVNSLLLLQEATAPPSPGL